MPLYHLVYFSTRANTTEEDIEDIVRVSTRNNARDRLTGCLFLDDRHFFQVLEGQRQSLSALLARLMQDKRHSDVIIADFAAIYQRSFSTFEMMPIRLDSTPIRETYVRYTSQLHDPTQLGGSEIWDMLESMSQTAEDQRAITGAVVL